MRDLTRAAAASEPTRPISRDQFHASVAAVERRELIEAEIHLERPVPLLPYHLGADLRQSDDAGAPEFDDTGRAFFRGIIFGILYELALTIAVVAILKVFA